MASNGENTSSEPERGPTLSHAPSVDSSLTHVQFSEKKEIANQSQVGQANGHGESALPEDKVEEALENLEDDWEDDPDNARNWSSKKKWTAVGIVRLDPGLPFVGGAHRRLPRFLPTLSYLHLPVQ